MHFSASLRLKVGRVTNLLLFIGGAFLVGTGVALETRLPPGSRGGHGLEMLGWTRHDWGALHFYVGLVLVGLILLHLGLHLNWIKRSITAVRAKLGLLGILAGLIAFLLPLLLPVVSR